MRASLCLSALAAVAWGAPRPDVIDDFTANPPIRNVYTFPKNRFIENIAVRSNSKLLITSMSVPDLFSIDPTVKTPSPSVVHSFTNSNGLMGITEVAPDVFAVVGGIWDLAATRAQLGSLQLWTVDFTRRSPAVKYITTIANSTIFNGIVGHPTNSKILFAADSELGAVWRVDLTTGVYGIAFSSPLMAPAGTAPDQTMGINGLKAYGKYIYFTNSSKKIFARVAIDAKGDQAGAVQIISNATGDVVYDDIALKITSGSVQSAWIASHPTYAVQVTLNGGHQKIVNDTELLLNPTSAAFGRGSIKQETTLYVTNGGEFTPDFDLINSGVVALEL